MERKVGAGDSSKAKAAAPSRATNTADFSKVKRNAKGKHLRLL